jgi:RNA polymerase sigma-70 factor (ECF subfamily)
MLMARDYAAGVCPCVALRLFRSGVLITRSRYRIDSFAGGFMTLAFFSAAALFALKILADRTLLDRLKGGDKAAIRALIERHHGALIGLAQTIVKDRARAEDVAQETWLSVVANLKNFDGRSSLSTWIIAILLNKAKTVARHERRYVAFADEAGDSEDGGLDPSRFKPDGHWVERPASFDDLDPERVFAGQELWRHVRVAIEALPPPQRAVIVMRDVEGCDAEETCDLLNLSAQNQRVLLHRARLQVRNAVENLARGPLPALTKV